MRYAVQNIKHPERCKADVGSYGCSSQCSRKVSRDGWCEQHHPDTKKRLDEKRTAQWKAQAAMRDRGYRIEAAERAVIRAALAGEGLEKAVAALREAMGQTGGRDDG